MRILVSGAAGRMGQEVCKAVQQAQDLELVGGVDIAGKTVPGLTMFKDLGEAIDAVSPDVVVDFTSPQAVEGNMEVCFARKIPMVIGTTGISDDSLQRWVERGKQANWRAIIAPNFAVGAVLMMEYAKQTAEFFSSVEIIEYHHDQKKDAPSGTALKTGKMIEEIIKKPVPIHSVRLPGFVAHQEVIFGLPGQTLTIRHDSTHRESFMPGVLLAISKINEVEGVVFGLEHILFSNI
ncbi:MAG: 4-hydroxy-tetrahydrodipicolinate reductase [Firmicutes bacterium]|jgi:4-hydroxy-tetrahydrodipicolinate reductase|nr:4-hydroxy-tetrahydrodipicolinate reductase [Bacillota bacterium]